MLDKGHREMHSSRIGRCEEFFFSMLYVCVYIKYYVLTTYYVRLNGHFIFGGGGGEVIYGHMLRTKRPTTTLFLQ